jgi:hypothetical protein
LTTKSVSEERAATLLLRSKKGNLAPGMYRQGITYIVCRCGAWSSVDLHDRCYMCRRALYADMPVTESPTLLIPGEDLLLKAINRAAEFTTRKRAELKALQQKAVVVCVGHEPRQKPDLFLPPGPAQYITNGCGSELPISSLTYIQTHWYTEPSGCTQGDYWSAGEGQFYCPACKVVNRLGRRHDVVALKEFFGDIEDVHNR